MFPIPTPNDLAPTTFGSFDVEPAIVALLVFAAIGILSLFVTGIFVRRRAPALIVVDAPVAVSQEVPRTIVLDEVEVKERLHKAGWVG